MTINFPAPSPGATYNFNNVEYEWDGVKWVANYGDSYVYRAGDTMTGNLTVPSLNGGQLAGFRNLLINGDFRVWQRGTDVLINTYNAEGDYGTDRWFTRGINNVGASSIEIKKVQDGPVSKARIVFNGTPSSKCFFAQRIEAANIKGYYGRQMTLSFNFENVSMATAPTPTVTVLSYNSANAIKTIVTEATPIPNVDGTKYSVTFTYDTTDGTVHADNERGLLVSININGSSAVSAGACQFWNVQLEPGPVATPFEHRPIGTELALCQRYFYSTGSEIINSFMLNAETFNRYAMITYPVTMRDDPTISVSWSGGSAGPTSANKYFAKPGRITGDAVATVSVTAFTADAEL